MNLELDSLADHCDVERALHRLYGADLASATGVIHSTAVWRDPRSNSITLKINGDTPRSRHDRFALNVTRARADAILTTGKVLREEQLVTPELIGSPDEVAPLVDWRRVTLGRVEQPVSLVLTSGRHLDLDHPFFKSPLRIIILTGHQAAAGMMEQALERAIEVVSHDDPTIHSAVVFLQRELRCATVAIEAGPTTSSQLYSPLVAVDELLMSEFLGPTLPPSVVGAPFVDNDTIEKAFQCNWAAFEVEESSGRWRFRRWTRRSDT